VPLFSQLPFTRCLKSSNNSDVGIEHITPVIGYYNSTPLALGRGIEHLAKKPAIHSIFVDPPLADRKPLHSSSPARAALSRRPSFSLRPVAYELTIVNRYRDKITQNLTLKLG
jgi:hypothetical protein